MDESRALRRAGWAGAASVVLIVVGMALCALVGVDAPGASDAAILDRINDGAKQTAAGIGLPVLERGDRAAALVRRRAAAGAGPAVRRRPARARDRAGGGAARRADDHRGVARRVERGHGIVGRVHPRPGHRPRARHGGGLRRAHRADRRRGAGRRDDADRPAGARPADVGRLGVLRRRRAVPVRLLERGHGVRGLRAVAHRRRHRGAAHGVVLAAIVDWLR